jgi:hypothetical protein
VPNIKKPNSPLWRGKPLIVYHANALEHKAPHLARGVGKSSFHAGTLNAALDRAAYQTSKQMDEYYTDDHFPEITDADENFAANQKLFEHGEGPEPSFNLHTYQIIRRPTMLTFEDPHDQGYSDEQLIPDDYVEALQVPEKGKRNEPFVHRYVNRWEDPGSNSFVISKNAVNRGYVKHLSSQQFRIPYEGGEIEDVHKYVKREMGVPDDGYPQIGKPSGGYLKPFWEQ